MREFTRNHLPAILWAALIGVGLLTPGRHLSRLGWRAEWLPIAAHFVLFGVLTLLLARSLRAGGSRTPLAGAFSLALLYGLALELAQIPVEGRGMEWQDVAIDALGSLAALGLVQLRRRLKR